MAEQQQTAPNAEVANEPQSVLFIIKIKAEKRQALFDAFKNDEDGIKKTKSFKGFISAEGRMSTTDDETIVIWGKFESNEDQAAYLKMRQEDGFLSAWKEDFTAPLNWMLLSKDSF